VQPKTTVTWAHTTRRENPDLRVRPLGAHPRTDVARAQHTPDGEGEPLCELPLRVDPTTTVTWAHTTRRGSPDLRVRPLGVPIPTTVRRDRMKPPLQHVV
jgi:hypothetical protein